MPAIQSSFAILFLIAAFIAVTAGTLFFIRFQTKLTGWAGVFSMAMALELTCYYLLLNSATPHAMQFWYRVLIVIYLFLSIDWLFFVILFTGHGRWLNPRNVILVGAVPILLAGVFMLYLPRLDPVWMNTIGSVTGWIRSGGLSGYLFAFYLFGIDFISAGLLILMISNNHPYFRNLALFLCAGTLMVIMAGFLELGGSNPFEPVSIVQLFKIVHSIMAFVGVFIFRGGHVLPVARDAAFKHIQDGLLVLDQNDNIVDLNAAAIQIIGQDEDIVIGKPITQVWQQGAKLLAGHSDITTVEYESTLYVNGEEQTFDVTISPVLDANRVGIGRVILLRNITRREQMGKALQERTRELLRTNKLVTALSSIAAHLGSAPDMNLGFDILGAELHKLGLDCAVATIDESQGTATIQYVSFASGTIRKIEKLTGVNIKKYIIPKHYWPGERIFSEEIPIWYRRPREIISRMFPSLPTKAIANQAWKLTGMPAEGQICIMPLRVEDRVIGAMPIWGADLSPSDSPVLAIFASQVAGILQNAFAYERELERANELARSNSIIMALSKVAAQLESSSDTSVIFDTVGNELKKMGLDSMVTVLDEEKQNLYVKYMPAHREVIGWIEKVSGHRLSEMPLPRRLWPATKVVDEKVTYWDVMKSTLYVLPHVPEGVQRAAMKTAGINLDDPVCYMPIATEDEVIGVLAVWGSKLNKNDVPALSILANQIAAAIRNSNRFEVEARRARELDILLKASEATSSSLDLDVVLLTLATQLLELSGFESCYISEWDREENLIYGRVEHSRILWAEGKRDAYSLDDYPQTKQVLMTGKPVILQGDFESEERQWMEQLGRAAVMILPLYTEEEIIGLVEIAMSGDHKLFTTKGLQRCEEAIINAAPSVVEPLSANDVKNLFALEEKLLLISGGDICSISEWDKPRNRVLTYAVAADQIFAMEQSHGINPDKDVAWKLALQEGKTNVWVHSEGNERIEVTGNGTVKVEVESLILFPLQKGDERIGLIELYDFNHKTQVSPEQLALLRAIADKAGFWIENARLLQQTQKRLEEQTELLHEKEVLLKEIHHRVKNNLQVISSLLSLQANRVSDAQVIQTLRDSQSRVRSMSLIHEKLYQSQSLAKIDFGEYVKSLAHDLFRSYRQNFSGVQLDVQADEVLLELDQAIPCGLILNELVTNALKYAYPDGRNGTIKVELRAGSENTVTLRVADDGVGMPTDFDAFNAKSLGLQLVASLVAQLDGKLEMRNLQGTDFLVSFPC